MLGEALRWRPEGGACADEGAEGAEEQAAAAGGEELPVGTNPNPDPHPDPDPKQEELPVGSAVKARFQGGALWRAGTVAEHNADGTIDVLYEDRTLEQGVPRDLVRGVNLTLTQTQTLTLTLTVTLTVTLTPTLTRCAASS